MADSNVSGVSRIASLPANIETNEYIDTYDQNIDWIYCTSEDNNFLKTIYIKVLAGLDRIDNLTPDQ